VGSRVIIDQNSTGIPGPGVRSGPFSQRPFLTLDFTNSGQPVSSDYGPLSSVPVSSQESSIVQDLLYCFIGISGVHIRCLSYQKLQIFETCTFYIFAAFNQHRLVGQVFHINFLRRLVK
jgi:hypothetical protein